MPVTGFQIKGSDGQTITVPDGEYYFNTKARGRRMCQNSLSSEARRVYAALELGTMGFQQEEAVVQTKSGRHWMTRADIAAMTDLEPNHVRRGLAELEGAGLAKRVPLGNAESLQHGKIKILSWAEPRPPEQGSRGPRAAPFIAFSSLFPDSLKSLVSYATRLKLTVSKDFTNDQMRAALDSLSDELEEAARDLENAENRAARLLERLCAQPPPYKEERTERTEEKERGEEEAAQPPPAPEVSPAKPNGQAVGDSTKIRAKTDIGAVAPGDTNVGSRPNAAAAAAVVKAPDPQTLQRFEQWRVHRNRCKKPVPDANHELRAACFNAFAAYSPPEQEQIVADTAARLDSWNAETKLQFIPGPLEYFRQQKWRTEPVQHVATMSNAEREKRDRQTRMLKWCQEMDESDRRKGKL